MVSRFVSLTRPFQFLKRSSVWSSRGLLSRTCLQRYEGNAFCTGPTKDGSSEPEPLHIKDIAYHLRRSVAGSPKYWSGEKTRLDVPTPELPERQDQLLARRMKDSYQIATLPIGTDMKLRQSYLTFYQTVRIGKILEDLDILAEWIAYLHIHGGREKLLEETSPHTVVTAHVHGIELGKKSILPDHDIRMSGNVTWVGKSSMEVSIDLCREEKAEKGGKSSKKVSMDHCQDKYCDLDNILHARFYMVSRNVKNNRAVTVNPLLRKTENEVKVFKKGEENHNKIIASRKTDLIKVAPTAEESKEIHNLMLKTSLFDTGVKKAAYKVPDNSILMEDTELSSVFVCHPQQRNCYNKIFGGFLLRKAFELSWATACLFSGSLPIFRAMDDVRFRKSVEIGSILEFTSKIVYTPPQPTNGFQIMTVADVIQPDTGERETTTIFHYTFQSKKPVRSIAPKTYEEAMRYLEGKRRYEKGQGNK